MAELLTHLTRLHETLRYYGAGLYRQLKDKNIFLWSQAIAFKVLITVVPVIILATGILAEILERETTFATVAEYIRNFLPAAQSDRLLDFLEHLTGAGDALTIIGVLTLLFSAMTLLTTLRVVVAFVFQEQWHEDRSIFGGYLFDLRMVGQVGLLFLLTLALTVAVQRINNAGLELIEGTGLGFLWVGMFNALGLLIPFAITTVMFFQLFYFVPKPKPPRQSAFFGALASAVLWEGAKSGFTLYVQYVGSFDRYSGEGTGDVLSSTFGLIIAFVFWVYYSGIALCLGAIMALLHEKRHRARRQTKRAAAIEATETTRPPKAVPQPDEISAQTTTSIQADTPPSPDAISRPTQPAANTHQQAATPPRNAPEDLSVK